MVKFLEPGPRLSYPVFIFSVFISYPVFILMEFFFGTNFFLAGVFNKYYFLTFRISTQLLIMLFQVFFKFGLFVLISFKK